jgi:hypoxanthine phosphoribosyltransferase
LNKKIDYNRVVRVPEQGLSIPEYKNQKIEDKYPLKSRIENVLIPEPVIKKRLQALAAQIASDYQNCERLYLIPILKGAFIFAADLGREIVRCGGPEIRIDFYEAETYGAEIKKKGKEKRRVKILRRPNIQNDSEVILLDDIGDTVQTVTAILSDVQHSMDIDRSRIRICFLLDKMLKNPSPQVKYLKEQLRPDYIGFEVPDIWVAGYGIDAGDDFRLLSCIISVKEQYYV